MEKRNRLFTKKKKREWGTHRAIISCIPACISSSPPRSGGLLYLSGPSPQLLGYSKRNYPYVFDEDGGMVLGGLDCLMIAGRLGWAG